MPAGRGHVVFRASGAPESQYCEGLLLPVAPSAPAPASLPPPPLLAAPPSAIGPVPVTLESEPAASSVDEEPSGLSSVEADVEHPSADHERIASSATRRIGSPIARATSSGQVTSGQAGSVYARWADAARGERARGSAKAGCPRRGLSALFLIPMATWWRYSRTTVAWLMRTSSKAGTLLRTCGSTTEPMRRKHRSGRTLTRRRSSIRARSCGKGLQ